MDWSKVDASLAGALAGHGWPGADAARDAERRLSVFVHIDADRADQSLLAELALGTSSTGDVRTGDLTPADVARLTEQPWVTRVRLSGPLRLLDG